MSVGMLEDLLLLRLWAAPDSEGEVRSRVAADLRPLAANPVQERQVWRVDFDAAVERLVRDGCLLAGGRTGARLRLSETGRQRTRDAFKISAEPGSAGKRRGWAWWRDHYALARALGGTWADSAGALRRALLCRLYLPELSLEGAPDTLQKAVDLLLAKRLGVGQATPGAFRQAVLREWAAPTAAGNRDHAPSARREAARQGNRLPGDLPSLAEQVLLAARHTRAGRFGDKVFVSYVWQGLLAAGQAAPEEADDFKARLVQANTEGRLRLSRADLAGAHAAQDVRDSEIHYLGETFHFIRLD